MTRLTYQDKDGGTFCPWERNSANGSYDIWDEEGLIQQINRLAAYEDTGLEPEEIERIMDAYGRGHTLRTESAERLEIVREIKTDRLRELAKAEQDGRLVVLPGKVVCGTVIWWADSNFYADPIKCEVSSFCIYTGPDGDLQVWMNCYVYGPTPMSKSFRMSSIGKTVFLTREEAEDAMKEDTCHA